MKSKKLSENILKLIKSEGFRYINLDTVIETKHIVERSGESFRRFIFSFNDQKGNEICLRPDLTIASCLKYLNEKNKALIAVTPHKIRIINIGHCVIVIEWFFMAI